VCRSILDGKFPVSESQEFPWTYDQYQRYAVVKEFLQILYPGKDVSLLDVGGVSPRGEGKSYWLPVRQISRNSVAVDLRFCGERGFIQGDGRNLPFGDESFDVCTALDVIEHLSKEDREGFLEELVRVTKGSVLVSAPFKDENIEEVENALFSQLKKIYGIEHQQLLEHRKYELPRVDEITQTLKKYMEAGAGFAFGSLRKWFFLQSLKNCYLNKMNSPSIHRLLDKWMVSDKLDEEFDPPFARHFWIYSKDIPQKTLGTGITTIKNNLKKEISMEFSLPELSLLNKEIVDFFSREDVSALVVSFGKKKHLKECLDHLLTQKIKLDLEVGVWNILGDKSVKKMIDSKFSEVKYFSSKKDDRSPNALLKILKDLKGDYILLISEDILLPPDSASRLYRALKKVPQSDFLSPRIIIGRHSYGVWIGMNNPLMKVVSGRFRNIFWDFRRTRSNWIYSECMMFRKEAVYMLRLKSRPLKRRTVFFWEKTKPGKNLSYAPDLFVYKKK